MLKKVKNKCKKCFAKSRQYFIIKITLIIVKFANVYRRRKLKIFKLKHMQNKD